MSYIFLWQMILMQLGKNDQGHFFTFADWMLLMCMRQWWCAVSVIKKKSKKKPARCQYLSEVEELR